MSHTNSRFQILQSVFLEFFSKVSAVSAIGDGLPAASAITSCEQNGMKMQVSKQSDSFLKRFERITNIFIKNKQYIPPFFEFKIYSINIQNVFRYFRIYGKENK